MKIRTVLEGNAFYDIDEECRLNISKEKSSTDINLKNTVKASDKTPKILPAKLKS